MASVFNYKNLADICEEILQARGIYSDNLIKLGRDGGGSFLKLRHLFKPSKDVWPDIDQLARALHMIQETYNGGKFI